MSPQFTQVGPVPRLFCSFRSAFTPRATRFTGTDTGQKSISLKVELGTKLLSVLKKELYSKDLKAKWRASSSCFIRDRILTFPLLLLIVNFVKGSLQDEVDQLFQAINKWDVARHIVSRSTTWSACFSFPKEIQELGHAFCVRVTPAHLWVSISPIPTAYLVAGVAPRGW